MNKMSYNCIEDITEDSKRAIGWRIQERRLEKGMTGADLGACLNVSANQISRIERGYANFDILKLLVICKALDTSADYILFGETIERKDIAITNSNFAHKF